MLSKRRRNLIFIEAGILTLIIYFFALILNGYLDNQRVEVLSTEFANMQLTTEGNLVEDRFYETFNLSYDCEIKKRNIFDKQKTIKQIGTDLSNFGQLFLEKNKEVSLNKQREYFLEEIELYLQVQDYNKICEEDIIVPVIYFFNSLNTQLDKQSLILEQYSLNHKNETIIFAFDINYENEPLLIKIKNKYEATYSPFVIIGNKTTRTLQNNNGIVDLNTITIEYKKIRGEI